MRRREQHHEWLVTGLTLSFGVLLAHTLALQQLALNQTLTIAYIVATVLYRIESHWLILALVALCAAYLPLAHQPRWTDVADGLMIDAFYLLIAVAVALLAELRRAEDHEEAHR